MVLGKTLPVAALFAFHLKMSSIQDLSKHLFVHGQPIKQKWEMSGKKNKIQAQAN